MHEIEIVECYTAYLLERGVKFKRNGFPVFRQEWVIDNKPLMIAPFSKRIYYHQDKKNISLCFFEKDEHLYPRLNKVFEEINIFRNYHSVCMMDISISPLMLDEVQQINLLINLLYICVLAVNGIKIIPSFRTASFETIKLLRESVGSSQYWVMGAVGTQRIRNNSFYEYLFREKCLLIMPKQLLIYGKPNKATISTLNNYGINTKNVYEDFRNLSYKSEVNYGRFKN